MNLDLSEATQSPQQMLNGFVERLDQTEETDGDRALQREGWPGGQEPAPGPARMVDGLRALRAARGERGNNAETAA